MRRVLRRPGLSLALSTSLLLILAAPVFGLNVGTSGVSALPDRFASKQGFRARARLPGTTTDPVEIVVTNASNQATEDALAALRTRLAGDPRFGEGEIRRSADGAVAVLSVSVQGDPSDEMPSPR